MFTVKKEITSEDITELLIQLNVLSNSGISLTEALQIIQQGQDNVKMSELIQSIQSDIKKNDKLSASLAKYPQYFQKFIVDVLRNGEQQKMLSETLDKIIQYRESVELSEIDVTGKLKDLLTYPLIVAMIVFCITVFLLIFVVPVFSDMFRSFGGDLPTITAFIIELSDFFVEWWLILFVIIMAIFAYLYIENKRQSPSFLRLKSSLILHTPLVGKLHHLLASIQILHTWALLFPTKMQIQKAIVTSGQVSDNQVYLDALTEVSQQVTKGISLADALEKHGIFEKKMVQTAAIAMKTKQPEKLFSNLASIYTKKLRKLMNVYKNIIEVSLLILLGCIVGLLVIAMYTPIFKMGSVT